MKKIMLVQYDEILSRTLTDILERLEYSPTLASSCEDAVAKVENGYDPDIVMLDLGMPGLSGSGTLPLLRTLRPTLPVLLTTGRVDKLVQEFVKEHKGVALLAKPFTMAELRYHLADFA
jgi:CheY-like chemotaxis protein